MAKDPAFLFYPGDYVSGTMHLNFECKGAYMDLLMLQFQKDHMSLHMIKQVLGHTFEHIWPLICDKFLENDGKYWNERLRVEKEKRIRFCKSRKDNKNKSKDMLLHMSQHMENENINTVSIGISGEKPFNQKPLPGDLNGLPEIKVGAAQQLVKYTQSKDITEKHVIDLWGVFKIQNLTGKKFYATPEDVHSHFINWLKKQDIKNILSTEKKMII